MSESPEERICEGPVPSLTQESCIRVGGQDPCGGSERELKVTLRKRDLSRDGCLISFFEVC
jgi:hypothetical protein